MKSKKTLIGLAAGAASVLVATPAQAAPSAMDGPLLYIYHGNDFGVIDSRSFPDRPGTTSEGVYACDMESDGNGVYIEGYYTNGQYIRSGDFDGANNYCSSAGYVGDTAGGYKMQRARVCENHGSCTTWRYYR